MLMGNRGSIGREKWINSVRLRRPVVCAGFARFVDQGPEGSRLASKKEMFRVIIAALRMERRRS
jgi:hypothetical protein